MSTVHERPGVWSAFGAAADTTPTPETHTAAIIAPADAAEGVHLVHDEAEAAALYGGNALLYRMLRLCLRNSGDAVYAVSVQEDSVPAYLTALNALFETCSPGIVILGSELEATQLTLRTAVENHECIGVVGMREATLSTLTARAKALCCARMVLVGPAALGEDEVAADGFCAAAALGGQLASLSHPAVPLHDLRLLGLQSVSEGYSEAELDVLIRYGVTPLQKQGDAVCALRVVTTRASALDEEGERFRSLNAVLVTDQLLRALRTALAERFDRAQNSTLTRGAIHSCVLLILQEQLAKGWLEGFENLRVFADEDDSTLCRVEFTYSIPAGLHRIALTAQLSL